MSASSVLRALAGEVVDFIVFVGKLLTDPTARQAREAILRDLGAQGEAGNLVLPTAPLASVQAYRDAVDSDLQADIAAAGDIAVLLGAIIDQIESWGGSDWSGRTDTFVNSLFDVLGSTYVRQRWPKLFLIIEAMAVASDLTGSYGPGDQALPHRAGGYHAGRFFQSFATIVSFVWNPGRTLDDLDDTHEGASGSSLQTARDSGFLFVDGLIRGILAAIAVIDQTKDEFDENMLSDVIVGWDAPGLDIDSDQRPAAADVLASRMVSLALRHDGDSATEELKLSWLYLPRRIGTPARPHQVFLALGGSLGIDQVLNPQHVSAAPEWRFRAAVKGDAGAALLIGGADGIQASPEASGLEATIGYVAKPSESGISYALPRATGMRVELGGMSFLLTLSATGARVVAQFDDCALVVDGSSADSFVRKLLGGKPYRTMFGFSLGYDSNLGFIKELHRVKGKDATTTQPVPFDSTGPAGPSTLDLTLPLGGGNLLGSGINLLELVVRLAGRRADAPATGWAVAAGALVTFSATWGPVYLKVDQLGLLAEIGTTKLQKDRNLKLVDAHVDAALPTGVAINIDTGAFSGGGAVHRDPASGDYYGAVVLRVGKRVTLTCLGLVSTRDGQGNPLTSFILIGTLEHLGLTAGFITLDGLGLLYAADRTLDVPAVRTALPSGKLKYLLFPADPIKTLPEMVAGLRTFFPPREGTHIYGLLVKLTFGPAANPLLRADLALMLERDGTTDSSRLLVLGRVSSVLPQEKAPLLTLNLDVVGEFDFDSGFAALDAVLYESKLFGRFALTGAAAFRRARGQGFALAIGGFNPRFTAPVGFPVVPRVTVALTSGDNPKLIIEAYLAITPNTLQFGATASLYAAAFGFSIEGYIGFDVLVNFWPPHFIADFKAGMQLKRGSRSLFKVDVSGTLEGPLPLRVAGKASFGILWWDYTVGFDKVLIGGSDSLVSEALDVLLELVGRLNDPLSWRTELPTTAGQLVGVRTDPAAGGLTLHPLGRLVVQQGFVPLNLDRDIDRVGAFVPARERRFAITSAQLGDRVITELDKVHDEFPDSQFFELTEAQRLSAPGMTVREAGVSFGNDDYATDAGAGVAAPFAYTEIVVGPDGVPVLQPQPQPAPSTHVLAGLRISASARALTRTSATERFSGVPRPDAPRLATLGLARTAGVS
ncbi:DUF6603 domain-containing protein [Micropruina sonneratiae]|uniref:DUF6603 domain-containing protein n=1 Tax=Micropruina sonneratiae TaxID=2986940 RepID=UPI0022275AA9|nr:DUF6603 domain-containing protein [Micropruina sp. KQZ13P-5]MCW3157697.1 hypothetical protein [Micropruina sp. KQZ13P-5]